MHHSLKEWKKELDKAMRTNYFTPTCDFCHEELFMSLDEAEIVLFEPKEIEEVVDVFDTNEFDIDEQTHNISKTYKKKVKSTVSSDPNKDIFKFKCPVCGHIIEIARQELYKLRVSYYGDNNIRFELDDVETQKAREFIKKHNHKEEFKKQGKLGFSTLGMLFTYEITPGGLGKGVVIKCNQCGESQDITNSDIW